MKEMHLNPQPSNPQPMAGHAAKVSRELLIRLAQFLVDSPYLTEDLLIFKGGLFLGEHTGHPRYTMDVDASITLPSTYEKIKVALAEFGEILVNEGYISTYEVEEDVQPKRSGGAKYRDIHDMVVLSIDVSLGAETLDTVVMTTSIVGEVKLESIEQVLTDKLTVLYSRSRFRRSKDLYDVWQIVQSCSIDTNRLVECLTRRGIYPLPVDLAPFREICYVQMEHAYNTLVIRDANTGSIVPKPSFTDVVRVVGNFTRQFMEAEV